LESTLLLLKQRPLSLFQILLWRLQGTTVLERQLETQVQPDFKSLPVHADFLAYLKQEHQNGRQLVLVTDAPSKTAEAMAAASGIFDSTISTSETKDKAALLSQRFGAKQYDYAGNGKGDSEILAAARKNILVTSSSGVIQAAQKRAEVEKVFPDPGPSLSVWSRVLRIYQWPKNLLLLAPMACAHLWTDKTRLWHLILALVAFCLCASSVYVLNDLLDLESDRHHPKKRHRPFAAGKMPLGVGLAGAPLLLMGGFAAAAWLPVKFLIAFALYYLLTLSYSLRLKQIALVDVLLLAGLYTLRVIAGGFATRIDVTDWLLAFSMFIFLSLAFVKRYTELQLAKYANKEKVAGRGYFTSDIELVSTMGIGCGYLSVLVLAFYINNPDVAKLYHRPAALWLACPVLLYWISRIWLLAHRKLLHDDPIVFTLTDKLSWLVGIIFMLIGVAASPV